jgi:hypothetical protein
MKKFFFFCGCCLVVLGWIAATTLNAQAAKHLGLEFSAVQVVTINTQNTHTRTMKLYENLKQMKVRAEGELLGSKNGILIVDFKKGKGYLLDPATKTFSELPSFLWQKILQDTHNAKTPCDAYTAGVKDFGGKITCNDLGPDSVEGYYVHKYQLNLTMMGTNVQELAWADPKTKVTLKLHSNNVDMLITQIKEGHQPESLFEIPAGYTEKTTPFPMMPNLQGR